MTFKEITHPDDLKESVANMEKLDTGKASNFSQEKRYIRKDGTVINGKISISPVKNKGGKPALFIAELEDITQSKIKDRELMQEKSKMETMAQSIGAGFVTISKDYRVVWANRFIRDYKGNVEGKLCYASLNDLNHACPDCGVKKIFENGVNYDAHEYASVDIKGNPYWVEIVATPIKDEKGNVTSAAEVAIDITEKKNLQQKLAQYSRSLEKIVEERTEQLKQTQTQLMKTERFAAIGELAGMVGHDLRNPLTGIKNAAYYLRIKGASISEVQAKEMLQVIEKSVEHSNKIINDLLDYSREIYLEQQKESPRKLLSEALSMVQKPENVNIINHLENQPPLIVDSNKIQRVFINLIKNSLDAMPNGGTVTIDSKEADGKIEISVTDTGEGIQEAVLPKIFSPLFTTKAQGMGFGLAICKRIVEAHEGTITVKTTKGKGTTFTIILPIEPKPKAANEKVWINLPESLPSVTNRK
jgi:PAS domain S-box-containing protein